MVLPGPSCLASRMAPATLMPRGAAEAQAFVLEQVVDHGTASSSRNQEGVVDFAVSMTGGDAA